MATGSSERNRDDIQSVLKGGIFIFTGILFSCSDVYSASIRHMSIFPPVSLWPMKSTRTR
jgi:hypothetical protein